MSVSAAYPLIRAGHESLTREALRRVFNDQKVDVVVAGRSLNEEWDAQLARVIFARNRNTAVDVGSKVAAGLRGEFNPDLMDEWLTINADLAASSINRSTRDALDSSDDKPGVFSGLLVAAAGYATSMVTTAANFGAQDGAKQAGGRTKTWVSSGGPRHAHMNGQSVPLSENFSNGMLWPGDPNGGAEEVANCRCTVSFD